MQLCLVALLKLLIPTQMKNNTTEVAFYVLMSNSFTLCFNYNNHTQMFLKKQAKKPKELSKHFMFQQVMTTAPK